MGHVTTREGGRVIVDLLMQKRPWTFKEFKDSLGMRGFDLKKLLRALETEKVIIRESYSGVEKFWLNENQAFSYLERLRTS